MIEIEQYLGVDLKRLTMFGVLISGAAVVITLIYWAVFGLDKWVSDAQTASDIMLAAATTQNNNPYTQVPAANQYSQVPAANQYGQVPGVNRYAEIPAVNQYPQMQGMNQYTQNQTCTSGQFLCPSHGAVGLPNYDAAGFPHCPICGQVMLFHSAANNFTLAAAAG